MLAGGTDRDRERLGSSITIDGDEFEVVDEFVYLGSLVTYKEGVLSLEVVPTMGSIKR